MTLSLEFGKRYRSRHGMTTTPLVPTPFPCSQPFAGYFVDGDDVDCMRTWSSDGSTASWDFIFDRDLVEEIGDHKEQEEYFSLLDRKMQFHGWIADMVKARHMPANILDIWVYDYICDDRPTDEDEPQP
jgi:hypothetical protein